MKSRVKTINQLVDETVKAQVSAARSEIYDDVSEDVAHQVLAAILVYLEKSLGWKKKRLTDTLCGVANFMNLKPYGADINPVTAIEYLKATYDIDIDMVHVKTERVKNDAQY